MEIPTAAKLAPPHSGAGTGLSGAYYNGDELFAALGRGPNAAETRDWLAGRTPDATFHSTALDYFQTNNQGERVGYPDDTTSLATFLGADGASISGTDPLHMDHAILTFDGYLNITEDLDTRANQDRVQVRLAADADDMFDMIVGGVELYHDSGVLSVDPGIYAFSAVFVEHGGNTALAFLHGDDDSLSLFGPEAYLAAAPVPEPGEWAMMVAGIAVAGVAARRRR